MEKYERVKKVYRTLPEQQRKRGTRVILWIVVRSVLNFVGMAGMLSVIYFLVRKEYVDYIALAISLCAIALILKMVALHYIDRYCTYWYMSIYKSLSTQVLQRYFQCGMLFIREKGVADLTYNTNGVCYAFATLVIPSILQSIGNICLVSIFLLGFLIYTPIVALLFILLVGIFTVVYIRVVNKDLSYIGNMETAAKKKQWKIVQDCFRGYVDVVMNKAFPMYDSYFRKGMDTIAECQYEMKKKSDIPAYLTEITILALLITVFFISNGVDELIMLLGAVSIGAFKILPSIRQIISGRNILQNQMRTTDIIYEALHLPLPFSNKNKEMTFECEISLCDISFSYESRADILVHLNLSFKKGERIGIRGRSGLGKTTLLNILLGFIKPDTGQVLVDEVDLAEVDLPSWHRLIGYLPQDVFITDASIAENIAFGCPPEKMEIQRIIQILKQVQLYDWVQTLPDKIHTCIGEGGCRVSCGQRQRLGIARVLYRNAKILILDEATSALDEATERSILNLIYGLTGKDSGKTLIMISHNQSSMNDCDRIISL